jgi:hypothetical protein
MIERCGPKFINLFHISQIPRLDLNLSWLYSASPSQYSMIGYDPFLQLNIQSHPTFRCYTFFQSRWCRYYPRVSEVYIEAYTKFCFMERNINLLRLLESHRRTAHLCGYCYQNSQAVSCGSGVRIPAILFASKRPLAKSLTSSPGALFNISYNFSFSLKKERT